MHIVQAWLLAAAAFSTASTHAAGIGQDGADAGIQAPGLTQRDHAHDTTPADAPLASPAGLPGFYGVDLSAAGPAARSLGAHALRSSHDHPYQDSRAATPGAGVAMRATSVLPAEQEGVPEPGTVAILSIGLAGLVLASRKKS